MTMSEPQQVFEYDGIYLSSRPIPALGKLRLASGGIGWKDVKSGDLVKVPSAEIKQVAWQRTSRQFGLRVFCSTGLTVRFDNFPEDSFQELRVTLRKLYDLDVDQREVCARGWNWGQTEFQGDSLVFKVADKPVLEVPISQVANTSMPSKTEVSLELKGVAAGEDKAVLKQDQLVEMRFFIPVAKANVTEDGQEEEEDEMDEDATASTSVDAAANFFETIKTMADIGVVTGESIVPFHELPFLTPRGRYEVDMFDEFMRMHGKSHDYKLLYKSIKSLHMLPKPDNIHDLFVIGLDPPIRQGQTRYPYLVLQFLKDEDIEVDTALPGSGDLHEKLSGKLLPHYEGPTADVVGNIMSLMTGIKIKRPSAFKSHSGGAGVKCSYKANEGYLYPTDDSLLFVPKPTTLMSYSNILLVTFSRVSAGASSSRTFDLKVSLKKGGEYGFGGLNREEHGPLEEYLQMRGVKVKNEMNDDAAYQAAIMTSSSEEESDGEPAKKKVKGGADNASAGSNDEESEDEDFVAGDDSDVAEEFDEEYDSSGEGSGQDDDGGDEDEEDDDDEEDEE